MAVVKHLKESQQQKGFGGKENKTKSQSNHRRFICSQLQKGFGGKEKKAKKPRESPKFNI